MASSIIIIYGQGAAAPATNYYCWQWALSFAMAKQLHLSCIAYLAAIAVTVLHSAPQCRSTETNNATTR